MARPKKQKSALVTSDVSSMSAEDKKRAIDAAINTLKTKYNESSFVDLTDGNIRKYDVISTGSMLLDNCIGIGGVPRGRIIEIYGPESSGKTTISDIICGMAQKAYPEDYVAIVDIEHAKDVEYSKKLGLDLSRSIITQPDSGEEAIDAVLNFVQSGACSVVVLDSVAALMTKRQLDGEVGDATVGEVARLMSENLKKIARAASKTNTLVIFINQIRLKIGVMFGSPETTSGGNSLKFYASLRLDTRRRDLIKDGDTPIGQVMGIKVIKSKIGKPYGAVDINLYFGKGFNPKEELVEVAIESGLIEKAGAWYTLLPGHEFEKRFQGKAPVIEYVSSEKDVYDELYSQYMSHLSGEDISFEIDEETGEILNEEENS